MKTNFDLYKVVALVRPLLPLVPLVIAVVGATVFVMKMVGNSEIFLLKNQEEILQEQVKILNQEVQEKTQLLQKLAESFKGNQTLTNLINQALKESVGILGPREIGVNEAVTLPNTNIIIVYENFIQYPFIKRVINFLLPTIIVEQLTATVPTTLSIKAGEEKIVTYLFPRAGSEVRFKYKDRSYRMVISAVREKSVRIAIFES